MQLVDIVTHAYHANSKLLPAPPCTWIKKKKMLIKLIYTGCWPSGTGGHNVMLPTTFWLRPLINHKWLSW